MRLLSCFKEDNQCTSRYNNQKTQQVQLPQDLHRIAPRFYGKAEFTKDFFIDSSESMNDTLMVVGGIGSADKVYLNGSLIGSQGYYQNKDSRFSMSAFNAIRAYRIPAGILQSGKNAVRIVVWSFDIKAGIHRGPILIGPSSDLMLKVYTLQFLHEFIFLSIPFLLLVVLGVFFSTMKYWHPNEGYIFLVIAFIGYFFHSLYYIPIPWYGNYLTFLQIQWIGRILSKFGTLLYFYRHFGLRNNHVTLWAIVFFSIEILFILQAQNFTDLTATILWQQWSFLLVLWLPLFWYKRISAPDHKRAWRIYIIIAIPVSVTYINDAFVISQAIAMPWLYHYMAMGNIINFLYHTIYHFYVWRNKEKQMAQKELWEQKLTLAHELHDMVGSQLSQMVVAARNIPNGQFIGQMSQDALDKVRDFSHILKKNEQWEPLPVIIYKIAQKLANLGRFEIFVNKQPIASFRLSPTSSLPDADKSKKTKSSQMELKEWTQKSINHYTCVQVERILSEWNSNIIRHTQATKIHFYFHAKNKPKNRIIRIAVFNNNSFFRWSDKAADGGLAGIYQRSQQIRGKVYSRPTKRGTLFILNIQL